MKKTATTITLMILTFTLIGTALGQERRRPTRQIGNPIGLGGSVTAGVKNRRAAHLGDTGTHEVGHKGKRRRGAIGEGASDVNAIVKGRTETVDNNEYRSKKPNTQNLLPYMEQSNLKAQPRPKQFGAGNQVEAKTKANGNQ